MSVMENDREEWRSARNTDTGSVRWIGGQAYDADDVPDLEDL